MTFSLVAAALLGAPVTPSPNLQTTTYRVQYLILCPAEMDGGLSVKVHVPGTSEYKVIKDPIAIWGSRTDCQVYIDGKLTDRAGLLAWLPAVRFPLVTVTRDMDSYGHVTEARFTRSQK